MMSVSLDEVHFLLLKLRVACRRGHRGASAGVLFVLLPPLGIGGWVEIFLGGYPTPEHERVSSAIRRCEARKIDMDRSS